MMLYPFIVISILLQYRHNNRITSCYNYCIEHLQYRAILRTYKHLIICKEVEEEA